MATSKIAKSILVVGANRGVGFNVCKEFAKRGWKVYGTIHPQPDGNNMVDELKRITYDLFHLNHADENSILQNVKPGTREAIKSRNCTAKDADSRLVNAIVNLAQKENIETEPRKDENLEGENSGDFQVSMTHVSSEGRSFTPRVKEIMGRQWDMVTMAVGEEDI